MIFYLSGTGNSLWAARQISRVTHDSLITMTETGNADFIKDARKGEPIGFVFPVHGWRPPRIVLEFINAIDSGSMSDRYVYAVVTAGDNIGETIKRTGEERMQAQCCHITHYARVIYRTAVHGHRHSGKGEWQDSDIKEKPKGVHQPYRKEARRHIRTCNRQMATCQHQTTWRGIH